MYKYYGLVTNVIDGDTLDVSIDVGFNLRANVRVRLLGVYAPEIHKRLTAEVGKLAKARLLEMFSTVALREVVVQTVKSDDFGRYLATVWYREDENAPFEPDNINERMIRFGYVKEVR
jgi:micrococcal nuclease